MNHFKPSSLARALALAWPLWGLTSPAARAAGDAVATLPTVTVQASRVDISQPVGASTLPASSLASPRAASGDSASLLRALPGLSLQGAGAVSSLPAIHGLADDRLRIQVDGMDLIASCPNHMNPALSTIDPTQLGELKVYAGITPVSAGGDSIGGTIVATSITPTFAAPGQSAITSGEVGAFYRSNNQARGANVALSHATEQFNLSYRGATSQADNYHAGADFKRYDFTGRAGHVLARDEVGSTAYETRNHSLALAWRSDNHLLEARLGWQDMPFQNYPNQRMDLLGNDQRSVNLRYLGQFDWGALEARAYHEKVDHFMDFGADKRFWYGGTTVAGVVTGSGGPTALNGTPCSPISAVCAAGMPMHTEGQTRGLSVKADWALTPQQVLRLGGQVQQYRLNDWWPPSGAGMMPGTFWNIRDGERDRSAVFAEWQTQQSAQLLTLVGARYERVGTSAGPVQGYNPATNGTAPMMNFQQRDAAAFNAQARSQTDHNLDLTALARYQVNATQDIEVGFAHKVRSPNLYERYSWSSWQMAALMNNFVGDGNGYLGNVQLKPEKANTLSATFDWHAEDKRWGVQATPFLTQVSDYIDAVQWNAGTRQSATPLATDRFSVLRYANQSARLYGLDLSGHLPLGQSEWGKFGLRGVLNYTHGSNRDTGQPLYQIMPLNATLVLTQQHGAWDNRAELLLVQAKDRVSLMRNEVRTPGYALVNLRASYSWQKLRVDVGVENLLNTLYYLPTGGTYVGQGTTMTNPALPNYPQWGTAVPGMGRSLYLGVQLKF